MSVARFHSLGEGMHSVVGLWPGPSVKQQSFNLPRPIFVERLLFLFLSLQRPNLEKIDAVVHGGELRGLAGGLHGQAKGATGTGMDRDVLDELAFYGELDEVARLVGIWIDNIVVGHQ
jgi:hypothetical protein